MRNATAKDIRKLAYQSAANYDKPTSVKLFIGGQVFWENKSPKWFVKKIKTALKNRFITHKQIKSALAEMS